MSSISDDSVCSMLKQLRRGELMKLLGAAKIPFKSKSKKQELLKTCVECRSDLMNLELIKKFYETSSKRLASVYPMTRRSTNGRRTGVSSSHSEDKNATVSKSSTAPQAEQPTLSSSTEILGAADAELTFLGESLPTPPTLTLSPCSVFPVNQTTVNYPNVSRLNFYRDDRVEGIRMTESPYYEVLEVLIPHTLLTTKVVVHDRPDLHQTYHTLRLTEEQIDLCTNRETGVKMQLRFCKYDPESDPTTPQGDRFPLNLSVTVNGQVIHHTPTFGGMPATEAQLSKLPSAPLINSNVRTDGCNNFIHICWGVNNPARSFAFTVNLVKKMSADFLFKQIQGKGVLDRQETVKLIKRTLSPLDEDWQMNESPLIVDPGKMKISLLCPITKRRMTSPCRAKTCVHIQCFDAKTFVMMYERKPYSPFRCPICNEIIKLEDLRIDGYFTQALQTLSRIAADAIDVLPNGNWTMINNRNVANVSTTGSIPRVLVDLASTPTPVPSPMSYIGPAYRKPECIHLGSSDEDDHEIIDVD